MADKIWLVPLLPLLGFIINGLFGAKLSKTLVGIIGTLTILASFGIVLTSFLTIPTVETKVFLFDFLSVGTMNIPFEFLIDPLSITMMLIITGIGTLIHLYSIGYMHDDESFYRFFAYLNLFIFFMLLLVLGSNYVIMFIGWEGVGLCSYLLIGFWFKNQDYNDAAKKAFIVNRVGDLGFLLGMFLIYTTFGSLEYTTVFSKAATMTEMNQSVIVLITLFLFIGAAGKSAQIPLYTWLPDAMAGPTPVSALIHAATMVTAGIYMIIRSNILYTLAPTTLMVVACVGMFTALFAATIGLVQNDIKKVLAYSTVSQLGYMFLALGVGAYSSALFHVMTHAFFKALLFLGSGSVIHAMSGEQDLRNMGGLKKYMPITYWTFLIGTIAISGIPPFSGFFSKDEILAKAFEANPILWGAGVLGALMTAFYMFRLFFLTFHGDFRGTEDQKHHLHESPLTITIPLMVLAILAMVGGWFNFPKLLGGTEALSNFLKPVLVNSLIKAEPHHLSHSTEFVLMGVSVFIALCSIIYAYSVYVGKKTVPVAEDQKLSPLHNLVYNKYFIDEIYMGLIVKPLYKLSDFFYNVIDVLGIDNIVNGVANGTLVGGKFIRKVQSGSIGWYVLLMVFGIISILFFNLLV